MPAPSLHLKPSATPLRRQGLFYLFALATIYLLVGLLGHDPWRGEDIDHFGPIYEILQGHGWLLPTVAGEAVLPAAPLYYWLGALLALLGKNWLPLHDAARLASALFVSLTLLALWRAARRLHGEQSGLAAILLLLGSLGLVVHAHEMQAQLALMAGIALSLAGLAEMPERPLRGALLAGLGGGVAMLSAGISGLMSSLPLLLLLPPIASRGSPIGERLGALLLAPAIALLLPGLWLAALWLAQPADFTLWLEAARNRLFQAGDSDPWRLLQTLGWFGWPAWPIALWGLWQQRARLLALPAFMPLLALFSAAWPLLNANNSDPELLLPLLPPLTLLAAAALPSLRRGAANAFDWFALMSCAVFAALIWMAWSAMALRWPPGLARHMAKVAPEFTPDALPLQAGLGLLICALWLWRAWATPRSPLRAAINWAQGVVLLWCLAVTLLMPWFDHSKSNRPLADALASEMRRWPGECVAGIGLGVSQRAAFAYFANLRIGTTPQALESCRLLLVRGERRASPAGAWREVWFYRRGGGRQLEVFRLYHHEP